jgi:multisubunit Na+/H+ antiporter MnhB subunit
MMSSVILRTAARFIVPLSLLFAAYIYFKGHNTPGGGFVAGLVAAVAMVVQMMCEGRESLSQLLPWRERTFIAVGLLLALAPGLGALLAGLPLLSSNFGYITWLNNFEWTTVILFDFGVVLVVCGVVVGMINALARETE